VTYARPVPCMRPPPPRSGRICSRTPSGARL